ncbi:MAG TPA: hypothetical protein VMV32_08740 [Ignavibacteriaceae bacterium]|nr:hypothetical protein [Ignavibacteriaceae bacterium]
MALIRLDNIENTKILRLSTGFDPLDEAFGVTHHGNIASYGMPCGRIVFASGEPGVGKTRLGIAITKKVNARGGKILVFQGEVRPQEFKQWTGSDIICPTKYFVSDDRDVTAMIGYIRQENPDLVIIDSANMIDDYDKSSEIKGIMDDLKIAVAETGCVCLMIGHLTKAGLMKGNSGVPHLVDVECSIIKVHTANMRSFDGLTFSESSKKLIQENNLDKAQYRAAMEKLCMLVPGMFRYNIGKNRYGPSGGWALFYHTATGIEYLDSPSGLDERMVKLIDKNAGIYSSSNKNKNKNKKASSWWSR